MRRSVVLALVPAVLLATLGWLMVRGQARARDLLVDRYTSRVEAGALFIQHFIQDRQNEEARIASTRFSARAVRPDDFDLAIESLGFEAAVLLDAAGRALAAYPAAPRLLGTEIASRYDHLTAAVAGRRAVSGVVPSAVRGIPVVALAVPYDTPTGRRVISGAFSVEVGPLGRFLQNMLVVETARAYLIDASGKIAASSEEARAEIVSLGTVEPELFAAIAPSGESRGHVERRGRRVRFFSTPIEGTSWRLVSHVDEAKIYTPLAGANLPQWLVFGLLVVLAGAAFSLVVRLERSRHLLRARVSEQARLNRALDDFSGRAAHDLRSPLAAMQMAIDLLESNLPDERRVEISRTLRNQALRASTLVNDLLSLAQASGTARRQTVDLRALVDEVARESGDVQIEIGSLPPTVDVDPVSLRQALLNLVRNARAYASGATSAAVRIDVERHDGFTIFAVADRGPGVPLERRERLFDAFIRGESAQPGTGLGLAIVGAMAEAHGGRAWYEDRPGGGAVFKFAIVNT